MKLRVDRVFPHNFIEGILLTKEFDFKFPKKRKEIYNIKKSPEFKDKVARYYASCNIRLENESNYKKLANEMNVEIQIRKNRELVRFGEGNKDMFMKLYNYIFL